MKGSLRTLAATSADDRNADKDEAALAALALVAGVVGYSEHCAF
jgi:hypothetical protein